MDITSLLSTYETQYASEITSTTQKTAALEAKASGDTVSISDEGRTLAAQLQESKVSNEEGSVFDRDPGQAGSESGADLAEGNGGGGGVAAGSSSDNADQIEQLQAKIAALSSQLAALMSGASNGDDNSALIGSIQSQISSLQAQLMSLESA